MKRLVGGKEQPCRNVFFCGWCFGWFLCEWKFLKSFFFYFFLLLSRGVHLCKKREAFEAGEKCLACPEWIKCFRFVGECLFFFVLRYFVSKLEFLEAACCVCRPPVGFVCFAARERALSVPCDLFFWLEGGFVVVGPQRVFVLWGG